MMVFQPHLDPGSELPLYRQLYGSIREAIQAGQLNPGDRLPPTRELSLRLKVNRTTVASAYELLEAEGFLKGHVGRGSFVALPAPPAAEPSADPVMIHFDTARPSEQLFPMAEFHANALEVLRSDALVRILQLGSPSGYAPLRELLLEQARAQGEAHANDDLVIVNGCQQGLDLIQRLYAPAGSSVLVEDPVYPGVKRLFERAGVQLLAAPVGDGGASIERISELLAQRPKLLVVTPNFQNPTGISMPLAARQALLEQVAGSGTLIVENDIYGDLRYTGQRLPTLRELDASGSVVTLRSFSKVAFPGLRVGWVLAARTITARIAEAKQYADLHADQLSQALLHRFAESGRLARHIERIRAAGRDRLAAALNACAQFLPPGAHFTRPEGGMNLWVRLLQPLDAAELLAAAQRQQVTYLPGRHFTVATPQANAFRLSFAGQSPARIEAGIAALGRVFSQELDVARLDAPAMV
jgi:2-aminoadipate transaminase